MEGCLSFRHNGRRHAEDLRPSPIPSPTFALEDKHKPSGLKKKGTRIMSCPQTRRLTSLVRCLALSSVIVGALLVGRCFIPAALAAEPTPSVETAGDPQSRAETPADKIEVVSWTYDATTKIVHVKYKFTISEATRKGYLWARKTPGFTAGTHVDCNKTDNGKTLEADIFYVASMPDKVFANWGD
jgi:hypothetical protein